jgi:alkylated DNA repair dioxygenase AlkB
MSLTNSGNVFASKQLQSMPQRYIDLAKQHAHEESRPSRYSRTGMMKGDEDVPERIEGAIAPKSLIGISGKLVKLHIENADIRYMSGMFDSVECYRYMDLLTREKFSGRWDRLGSGRWVVQWSDPPGIRYVFSETAYVASRFPKFVEEILNRVVDVLRPIYGPEKTRFNYCVCNWYTSGLSGVSWHTDAEPHLVADCPIACVSFGSERVFSLAKVPSSVTANIVPSLNVRLESGSMIVMAGDTQKHYLHAISKELAIREARFSLTFRVNYTS